jgi:hypothetical protein
VSPVELTVITGKEGEGDRQGAESFDGKKARSFINNSILSGYTDWNSFVFLKVNRNVDM